MKPKSDLYEEMTPEHQADHDRSVYDYPDIHFSPTEYVVIDVERSILGLVRIWLVAFVAFFALSVTTFVLAYMSPVDARGNIMMIGLMLALGSFIGGVIAARVFKANYFIITNERVFAHIQISPFSQLSQNVELEHIEDCSYHQNGLLQTIFNYGSIRLSTVGDEHTYKFTFVDKPAEQFKIINSVVQQVDEGETTKYTKPSK
jgi:Bacterial membrane flanked domain.